MHPADDNELGKLKSKYHENEVLLKDYKLRFNKADMEAYKLRVENAQLKLEVARLKEFEPVAKSVEIKLPVASPVIPMETKEKKISWWNFSRFWR